MWPVAADIATVTGTAMARFHDSPAAPTGTLKIPPPNRELPD